MAQGQRPPMGMMPQPQGQWQVRYPQEVTLQQRGPMMGGPPQQVVGLRGPVPQRMPGAAEPRPAFIRQESLPTPPPPLNTKAMTPPPENPQTDADRAKVVQYEQWLNEHNKNIEEHLRHYETEISKLRKQRKSLTSKQRTMRKNGNELSDQDQNELTQITAKTNEVQKTVEKYRKESRSHAMRQNDYKNKKDKAMGIDPNNSGGTPMGGGMPPQQGGVPPGMQP